MKTFANILTLALLLICSNPADAQFLKKLKKAVTDAVETKTIDKVADKVSEKVSDEIVESLDGVIGEDESVNSDESSKSADRDSTQFGDSKGIKGLENLGKMMTGIMQKVETEDQYNFDILTTIEVIDAREKKYLMTQGFSKNAMSTYVDDNKTIIDFDNQALILLDDEKKEAQAISMSWGNYLQVNLDHDPEYETNLEKTGKTKVIIGYQCNEYKMTHEDGSMDLWLTDEVDFDYSEYMIGFKNMFDAKSLTHPYFADKGYMMEMTAYDKKGKVQNKMTVLEIAKKPFSVDLSEYKITQLADN